MKIRIATPLALLAITSLAACGQSGSGAQEGAVDGGFPSGDTLALMIPGDAGGGWDATGRSFAKAFQDAGQVETVEITNMGGAAGTIGLASFVEQDNPDSLSITGSTMVGGIILNDSPSSLTEDVEPAAVLADEYIVLAVPADSPYENLDDFIAELKQDPASVPVAVGSTGGVDHLAFGLMAQTAGVEPSAINAVSFKDGGLTSVLNGDVKAGVSTMTQWQAQYESGDLKVLGVTSPERLDQLDAPTFIEQGVDVEFSSWRGLLAPKSIGDSAALEDALTAAHDSASWQETLEVNGWVDNFKVGEEADAFFEEQEQVYQELIDSLGL